MSKPRMPKRATAVVFVCIDPDLAERLTDAEAGVDDDGGDGGPPKRLGARKTDRETLAAQQRDAFEPLTLQALPRARWRELIDRHPPRDGNRVDKLLGINHDNFYAEAVAESIVDPEADEAFWDEWLAALSAGEWRRLTDMVRLLNERAVDAPKSLTDSSTDPTSVAG